MVSWAFSGERLSVFAITGRASFGVSLLAPIDKRRLERFISLYRLFSDLRSFYCCQKMFGRLTIVLVGLASLTQAYPSGYADEAAPNPDVDAFGVPIVCVVRDFNFTATVTDRNGKKCRGQVHTKACFGSCESYEVSDPTPYPLLCATKCPLSRLARSNFRGSSVYNRYVTTPKSSPESSDFEIASQARIEMPRFTAFQKPKVARVKRKCCSLQPLCSLA